MTSTSGRLCRPRVQSFVVARRGKAGCILVLVACAAGLGWSGQADAGEAGSGKWQSTIREAQSKVVKIYGAGGLRRMEAYQTGILVSPQGHVLTAWSYVLDTEDLVVIRDDGRKSQAELIGHDPILELALLKLPLEEESVPYFELHTEAPPAFEGQRVLALSNLYGIATGDEAVSVLQGVVMATAPLNARRGALKSNYQGEVYVLDASTSNPGAAGGALVDWNGMLLGVLGKESRSRLTGTWLNYALPTASFRDFVEELMAGRAPPLGVTKPSPRQPLTVKSLGLVLIPNVLARTPPYVDSVRKNSAAERVGLRPDDLVVFIAEAPITSCRALVEELCLHDHDEELAISVLRDGALLKFSLVAEDASAAETASGRTSAPDTEEP